MEQSSSNRSGITNSSYHGPEFGYWTYHCCTIENKGDWGMQYRKDYAIVEIKTNNIYGL